VSQLTVVKLRSNVNFNDQQITVNFQSTCCYLRRKRNKIRSFDARTQHAYRNYQVIRMQLDSWQHFSCKVLHQITLNSFRGTRHRS